MPAVKDLIEVEVEEDGVTDWRLGQVSASNQRSFTVTLVGDDEDGSTFSETYTMADCGKEWRWPQRAKRERPRQERPRQERPKRQREESSDEASDAEEDEADEDGVEEQEGDDDEEGSSSNRAGAPAGPPSRDPESSSNAAFAPE